MTYLEITDRAAFKGMQKKDPKDAVWQGAMEECPRCHGYGGYHLRLDAYGPDQHFNASCSQCNGWGYVKPGKDTDCIHEFKPIKSLGNCLTLYQCTKCEREWEVDSSG